MGYHVDDKGTNCRLCAIMWMRKHQVWLVAIMWMTSHQVWLVGHVIYVDEDEIRPLIANQIWTSFSVVYSVVNQPKKMNWAPNPHISLFLFLSLTLSLSLRLTLELQTFT